MDFLKRIPLHVDFKGQQLAERLFQAIVVAFSLVGFVAGYAKADFGVTFYVWAAGFALALLVAVPPWPWYRRHPVQWLSEEEYDNPPPPPRPAAAAGPAASPAGSGTR